MNWKKCFPLEESVKSFIFPTRQIRYAVFSLLSTFAVNVIVFDAHTCTENSLKYICNVQCSTSFVNCIRIYGYTTPKEALDTGDRCLKFLG